MPQLDMNNIINLVAEGKLTVDQVNYLLNSGARYTERSEDSNKGQETREVSSPGQQPSKLEFK